MSGTPTLAKPPKPRTKAPTASGGNAKAAAFISAMLPLTAYVFQDQSRQIESQRLRAQAQEQMAEQAFQARQKSDRDNAERLLETIAVGSVSPDQSAARSAMCQRFYLSSEMVRVGVHGAQTLNALNAAMSYRREVPANSRNAQTDPLPVICDCPVAQTQIFTQWTPLPGAKSAVTSRAGKDFYQALIDALPLCSAQQPAQAAQLIDTNIDSSAATEKSSREPAGSIENPDDLLPPIVTGAAPLAPPAQLPVPATSSADCLAPVFSRPERLVRVYVQATEGLAGVWSKPGQGLSAQLAAQSYIVPAVESRTASLMPKTNELRYVHEDDRAEAERLLANLNQLMACAGKPGFVLHPAMSRYKGKVARYTFEAWYANNTPQNQRSQRP